MSVQLSVKATHYVVDFQHIDDHRGERPLHESLYKDDYNTEAGFEDPDSPKVKALEADLENLFREAGWEGDGDITCIFVPPCFQDNPQTHCEVIYHVKQSNNGTSWLAIPWDLKLSLAEGFLSRAPRN